MRAAISLLIPSLVFGSLAFNYQATTNNFSHNTPASFGAQQLLSVRPKPKTNQPENPAPHRGSGRRELMEYYSPIHPAV